MLSQLVGEQGYVTGVDMTEDQVSHSAQAWTIGSRTTDWTRTKSRDMLFHPVSILLVSVTPKRHMSLYQAVIGATVSS